MAEWKAIITTVSGTDVNNYAQVSFDVYKNDEIKYSNVSIKGNTPVSIKDDIKMKLKEYKLKDKEFKEIKPGDVVEL
jgi:hypothetical protein